MNSRPPVPPSNNLQPQQPPTGGNMPMSMPLPSAPPYDRHNSTSSSSANDDGWVLVPSQTESDAWNNNKYTIMDFYNGNNCESCDFLINQSDSI